MLTHTHMHDTNQFFMLLEFDVGFPFPGRPQTQPIETPTVEPCARRSPTAARRQSNSCCSGRRCLRRRARVEPPTSTTHLARMTYHRSLCCLVEHSLKMGPGRVLRLLIYAGANTKTAFTSCANDQVGSTLLEMATLGLVRKHGEGGTTTVTSCMHGLEGMRGLLIQEDAVHAVY